MSDTTFTAGTVIASSWLNDVNDFVYTTSMVKTINTYGLADWTDITTLLQAAADTGGAWNLPKGNFSFSTVSITQPFILIGAGDSTVLRRNANLDTTSPSASTAIGLRVTAHNISVAITNLCLDGNQTNQIVEAYGTLAGFSGVAGADGSVLSLAFSNVTFTNATQSCIRADGDTATAGRENLIVQNCRFINGRPGAAAGDVRFVSTSGYGPDYITLTDKVYADIGANQFLYYSTLTSVDFAPTAVRITFSTNTTNADGSRASIYSNYFYRCGRGERATTVTVTGGTGTGLYLIPTALSGSSISTFTLLYGGTGYTAGDTLTATTGGATFTVSTVSTAGTVTALTLAGGGTGYSLPIRPVNDVGVIDAYARGRELRIYDNLFEDCLGSPIRGKTSCDLVTIHNNVIDSCGQNPGINIGPNSYAEQSGRISICENIIRQTANYAIGVVGNAGATTSGPPNTQLYVADVLIKGNIIEGVNSWNAQLNPVQGEGIYCRNFRNLNIVSNMIGGPTQRGVYLRGQAGTYNSAHTTIIGNRVEGAGNTAFESENSLAGNMICVDNSVVNGKSRGFSILATSGATANLIISNNSIDGAYDYGIYTRYWDTISITGNHLENVLGLARGIYPQDTIISAKVTGNLSGGTVTTPLFGGGTAQNVIHDKGNSWNAKELYGTAAPTTNAWTVGDIVWNTTPTAGGTLGWVCTTAGTPGTWKTFGGIAP